MTIQIGKDSPGKFIPVKCDHENDEEVKELFDKVSKEQNGRLDVLVNNAYAGVQVSHLFYLCPHTKLIEPTTDTVYRSTMNTTCNFSKSSVMSWRQPKFVNSANNQHVEEGWNEDE